MQATTAPKLSLKEKRLLDKAEKQKQQQIREQRRQKREASRNHTLAQKPKGHMSAATEHNKNHITWLANDVTDRLDPDNILDLEIHFHTHLHCLWKHASTWSIFHLDLLIEVNRFLGQLYDEYDLIELCDRALNELRSISQYPTPAARRKHIGNLRQLVDWYIADLAITPRRVIVQAECHADTFLQTQYASSVKTQIEYHYFSDVLNGESIPSLAKKLKRPASVVNTNIIAIAVWISRIFISTTPEFLIFETDKLTDLRKIKGPLIRLCNLMDSVIKKGRDLVEKSCLALGFAIPYEYKKTVH